MLITAFTIFNTGVVYTPGDAHISDMQIQQLGYDALLMMDTPDASSPLSGSPLAEMILVNDSSKFKEEFNDYLEMNTSATDVVNSLEYKATIYNRVNGNTADKNDDYIDSYDFAVSDYCDESQLTHEPAISVSRYVWISGRPVDYGDAVYDNDEQLVLLEVLIWRR